MVLVMLELIVVRGLLMVDWIGGDDYVWYWWICIFGFDIESLEMVVNGNGYGGWKWWLWLCDDGGWCW
jgi:hypothetical protein